MHWIAGRGNKRKDIGLGKTAFYNVFAGCHILDSVGVVNFKGSQKTDKNENKNKSD